MSNNSSPSVLGIIKDVGGVSAKLVKLSFKGIGYTARGAHKPKEQTQLEFDFREADNNGESQ